MSDTGNFDIMVREFQEMFSEVFYEWRAQSSRNESNNSLLSNRDATMEAFQSVLIDLKIKYAELVSESSLEFVEDLLCLLKDSTISYNMDLSEKLRMSPFLPGCIHAIELLMTLSKSFISRKLANFDLTVMERSQLPPCNSDPMYSAEIYDIPEQSITCKVCLRKKEDPDSSMEIYISRLTDTGWKRRRKRDGLVLLEVDSSKIFVLSTMSYDIPAVVCIRTLSTSNLQTRKDRLEKKMLFKCLETKNGIYLDSSSSFEIIIWGKRSSGIIYEVITVPEKKELLSKSSNVVTERTHENIVILSESITGTVETNRSGNSRFSDASSRPLNSNFAPLSQVNASTESCTIVPFVRDEFCKLYEILSYSKKNYQHLMIESVGKTASQCASEVRRAFKNNRQNYGELWFAMFHFPEGTYEKSCSTYILRYVEIWADYMKSLTTSIQISAAESGLKMFHAVHDVFNWPNTATLVRFFEVANVLRFAHHLTLHDKVEETHVTDKRLLDQILSLFPKVSQKLEFMDGYSPKDSIKIQRSKLCMMANILSELSSAEAKFLEIQTRYEDELDTFSASRPLCIPAPSQTQNSEAFDLKLLLKRRKVENVPI